MVVALVRRLAVVTAVLLLLLPTAGLAGQQGKQGVDIEKAAVFQAPNHFANQPALHPIGLH